MEAEGVGAVPKLSPTASQTRQNIKDAFWRLYTQHPIRKITVSEVCAVAGYNRSTFYAYFQDIYGVLDAIETELIAADDFIAVVFNDLLRADNAQRALERFLSLFEECSEYFTVLLGKHGDPGFREKLLSRLSAAFAQALPAGLSKSCRYVLEYQNAGVMMTIARWYENDKDIPDKTLVDLLLKLTRQGTQTVFGQTCGAT